jgi:hypothetical protein
VTGLLEVDIAQTAKVRGAGNDAGEVGTNLKCADLVKKQLGATSIETRWAAMRARAALT